MSGRRAVGIMLIGMAEFWAFMGKSKGFHCRASLTRFPRDTGTRHRRREYIFSIRARNIKITGAQEKRELGVSRGRLGSSMVYKDPWVQYFL